MIRNYLLAAWRYWLGDRVSAMASFVGLAIAFAAALLIAIGVEEDLGYDRFTPDHEDVYLLVNRIALSGREPLNVQRTPLELGNALREEFGSIRAVARIRPMPVGVRNGDIEDTETIYWADPDVFEVLRLPVVAGDPSSGLRRPDGVVVSRRFARKYFGRDDVVGARLELDREHAMTVTAVLEDLPSSTHLRADIWGSSLAPFSFIAQTDQRPASPRFWFATGYIYVRMNPGQSVEELEAAMPEFVARQKPLLEESGAAVELEFVPLSRIHLAAYDMGLTPGTDVTTLASLSAVGVLMLVLACINFASLTLVRAMQRTGEVAVRRVFGAGRRDLLKQFVGEAACLAGLCMLAGAALAAVFLPTLNEVFDRELSTSFWRRPGTLSMMVSLPLLVGSIAGGYPAVVVGRLRPASFLRGSVLQAPDRRTVRHVFVALNFAILIGLMIVTGTMYQQVRYALDEALRVDVDQVLLVETNCQGPLRQEVQALAGVRAAACSWLNGVASGPTSAAYPNLDGQEVVLSSTPVDFGYFELYGIEPLAGRLFSEQFADAVPADPAAPMEAPVIVNETAARLLGYGSPDAAIGGYLLQQGVRQETRPSQIIGVVPDFAFDSIRSERLPMIYYVWPTAFAWLHVKLDGNRIPETLREIDRLWDAMGTTGRPITRFFLDEAIEDLYQDITRQVRALGMAVIVALAIACLGLLGLVSYVVDRRTREMAIRKALGASRSDVCKLLLWQFMKPVMLATVLAWSAAYLMVRQWLAGFAYRIDPDAGLFVLASVAAAVVATLVVLSRVARVATSPPVALLRRTE